MYLLEMENERGREHTVIITNDSQSTHHINGATTRNVAAVVCHYLQAALGLCLVRVLRTAAGRIAAVCTQPHTNKQKRRTACLDQTVEIPQTRFRYYRRSALVWTPSIWTCPFSCGRTASHACDAFPDDRLRCCKKTKLSFITTIQSSGSVQIHLD